jgi:hypothetical protein
MDAGRRALRMVEGLRGLGAAPSTVHDQWLPWIPHRSRASCDSRRTGTTDSSPRGRSGASSRLPELNPDESTFTAARDEVEIAEVRGPLDDQAAALAMVTPLVSPADLASSSSDFGLLLSGRPHTARLERKGPVPPSLEVSKRAWRITGRN